MSLSGKTKPQHALEAEVTEDQEKGERAMLVIQVKVLGSALCLPAKDVLSYIILSQRIKDQVKSKEEQAKFNSFLMAAQHLTKAIAKHAGVLLHLMPCAC